MRDEVMSINNPPVHPSPASQIEGITLFDAIMLALISRTNNGSTVSIELLLDATKEILNLRNTAIQNLDNYKSMKTILEEREDDEEKIMEEVEDNELLKLKTKAKQYLDDYKSMQ